MHEIAFDNRTLFPVPCLPSLLSKPPGLWPEPCSPPRMHQVWVGRGTTALYDTPWLYAPLILIRLVVSYMGKNYFWNFLAPNPGICEVPGESHLGKIIFESDYILPGAQWPWSFTKCHIMTSWGLYTFLLIIFDWIKIEIWDRCKNIPIV